MDKKDTVMMTIKALVSCIPYVGGGIASIIGDCYSDRKEQRWLEFINDLQKDIEKKQDKIVREYVESQDFFDVFENILRDAMNTRTELKRKMLKNLIVSSCTIPRTSYERTEEFQHLIDVLSPTSLLILFVFYKFRDIHMDAEKSNIEKIWSEIRKITYCDDDVLLMDYIGELENRCLIESFKNNTYSVDGGTPLVGDSPYITKRGLSFYAYITLQNDEIFYDQVTAHSLPKAQLNVDELSEKMTIPLEDIEAMFDKKLENHPIIHYGTEEPKELKNGEIYLQIE